MVSSLLYTALRMLTMFACIYKLSRCRSAAAVFELAGHACYNYSVSHMVSVYVYCSPPIVPEAPVNVMHACVSASGALPL